MVCILYGHGNALKHRMPPTRKRRLCPGLPVPGYDGLRFGLPCRKKLRELWRTRPTDIIYVATEGPLGQSAIRAAEDLDIPVTSGFHTNFHEYMRHYNLPLLAKAVEGFLRQTHNRTSRTFAPSGHIIKRLQNMGIKDTCMLGRGSTQIYLTRNKGIRHFVNAGESIQRRGCRHLC